MGIGKDECKERAACKWWIFSRERTTFAYIYNIPKIDNQILCIWVRYIVAYHYLLYLSIASQPPDLTSCFTVSNLVWSTLDTHQILCLTDACKNRIIQMNADWWPWTNETRMDLHLIFRFHMLCHWNNIQDDDLRDLDEEYLNETNYIYTMKTHTWYLCWCRNQLNCSIIAKHMSKLASDMSIKLLCMTLRTWIIIRSLHADLCGVNKYN